MAAGTPGQSKPGVTRRIFLKGAAATAGVVTGSGLVTGLPTIWAQKLKEITLLHVGGSYSAIIDIARQATKDLGFKIDMQNAATDALVNRVATQPQSLDIADLEYWMPVKLLPRGVLQGIDLHRSFWTTFDESVNLMASGEVTIQSMWSPAVTAVRARDIPCYYAPLKEGYRAWAVGLGLMAHLSGLKLDAAYEYLNWYLSGWQGGFIAKQGYYSAVPESARQFLTPDEWDYWYAGKPARSEIKDPYGNHMENAGHVRDGGSLWERMGKIACWNTVMDENRHMVRRWNEFVAA